MTRPDERNEVRFRVEVAQTDGGWEANVYDHADHGPDVIYAAVWCTSLDRALREAMHYLLVAATDDVVAREART